MEQAYRLLLDKQARGALDDLLRCVMTWSSGRVTVAEEGRERRGEHGSMGYARLRAVKTRYRAGRHGCRPRRPVSAVD